MRQCRTTHLFALPAVSNRALSDAIYLHGAKHLKRHQTANTAHTNNDESGNGKTRTTELISPGRAIHAEWRPTDAAGKKKGTHPTAPASLSLLGSDTPSRGCRPGENPAS